MIGVGSETWRSVSSSVSAPIPPRLRRRRLPDLGIQLAGELKCIDMERLGVLDGVALREGPESLEFCGLPATSSLTSAFHDTSCIGGRYEPCITDLGETRYAA